jgi:hypothetical protein
MTAAAVVDEELAIHDYPRIRSVLALAWVEARRMVLHPAYLVGTGYVVVVTGSDLFTGLENSRKTVIDAIELFVLFLFAIISIFPPSLVASSARRAGAEETLAALPATQRMRTAAILVGACLPAAIATVPLGIAFLLRRDLPLFTDIPEMTGLAAASTPLLYLGTAALACAAARWLPWPGVPIAVMAGLVLWTANTHERQNPTAVLTAPWLAYPDRDRGYVIAGYSAFWHLGYLLGLVLLAATAALWRDDVRRMVAIGIPVGLFTVLAAWAQLP